MIRRKSIPYFLLLVPVVFTFAILSENIHQSFNSQLMDNELNPSDLTPHSPISISGDSAMNTFFAGNGTTGLSWASAHVLENISIDAGGSGDCIYLYNTNLYLIIRNCSFNNTNTGSAIRLDNCNNVKIENVTSVDTYYGVFADDSNYNIIANSSLNASYRAVYFYDTDYNNIINNTLVSNQSHAFIMDYGDYNNITMNYLYSEVTYEINFYDQAGYNLITKNYIDGSVRDDSQTTWPANYWNDTLNGNFHADADFSGQPNNGIVYYTAHPISGSPIRYDNLPLMVPGVYQVNENTPSLSGGGVNPSSGTQDTLFTFSVTYSDADRNEPISIDCVINGTVFAMSKQNPSDYDYLSGVVYEVDVYLQPGSHDYYFQANDESFSTTTSTTTGFTVTLSNAASPTLGGGQVNPVTGPSGANYAFQVVYYDADNNAPELINVSVNGTVYPMNKVDPLDTNYIDGATYNVSAVLTTGDYTYQFAAYDGSYSTTLGPYAGPVVSNLIYSGPISITSNTELDTFCFGDGTDGLTPGSAHRIANLSIDGGGDSGINIENTNRYLIIENCVVSNCGNLYPDSGIRIYNAQNVNITGCTVSSNWYEIMLQSSSDCVVKDTIVQGTNNYGIYFYGSTDCLAENNTVYMTSGVSFRIYAGSHNTIQNCTAMDHGMNIYQTNYNTVYDCQLINCIDPFYLQDSDFNNITGNVITDGSSEIFYLYQSNNNTIEWNNITAPGSSPTYGFDLRSSQGNILTGNLVQDNDYGIRLRSGSSYNRISKNAFMGNTFSNGLTDGSDFVNWLDDGLNGNYWDDYTTVHPTALNNGIIWETPYNISLNSIDNEPLVAPFVFQPNDYAPRFASGNVNPAVGLMTQEFNFSVTLIDDDNNHPDSVSVVVNGTWFAMQKVNPNDVNYSNGCDFSVNLSLQPGTYEYYFSATDPGFTNVSSTKTGPTVNIVNDYDPVVTTVEIYPFVGYEYTTYYTYYVNYSDQDNNEPISVSITVDGSTYLMIREDPTDIIYTDGTLFSYQSYLSAGEHEYYVNATDDSRSATTGVINEPYVKPNLDWDTIPLHGVKVGCVTTHGEPNPQTSYSNFVNNYLDPRGPSITTISTALSVPSLSNYDVAWFASGGSSIPLGELDALFTWIASGGKVFVSGGSSGGAGSIISRLNISMYSNAVIRPIATQYVSHSIMIDITGIYFDSISSNRWDLSNSPRAINVAAYNGHCLVAAYSYGYGEIVMLSDATPFSFLGNSDNLEFLQNVFGWLGYSNDNTPAFTSGQVLPSTGNQGTLFNFSVIYSDVDNNLPVYVNLVLDGLTHPLSPFNVSDVNYTDGSTYFKQIYVQPGNHTYYFEAEDYEFYNRTANITGFIVSETNAADPQLNFPGFTPAAGDNLTIFTFNVTYSDADNNMPAWINISINGNNYTMVKDNPLDTNAMNGVVYKYSRVLNWGAYEYKIYCSDGSRLAETSLLPGPDLNPFNPSNDVSLVSPANQSSIFTGLTTFTWNSLNLPLGQINYTIEISNTSDFASIVDSQGGIPEAAFTTQVMINIVQPSGIYYWRVKPEYNGAFGNATAVRLLNVTYNENSPQVVELVSPISGNQLTVFNFTLNYTDTDNNYPYFVNVSINSTLIAMQKVNLGDSDYTDGCLYYYASYLPVGDYEFFFTTGDGKYNVTTTLNTSLSVIRVNDFDPELLSTQVDPVVGYNTTSFNFSTWYFDADNNLPIYLNITINGTGTFNMTKVNGSDFNATDGILYEYVSLLDWGYYEFMIQCYEDNRTNTTGWINGPEVNPFYGYSGLPTNNTLPFNDTTIFSGNITFTWDSMEIPAGAVNYTWQLSNTTSFSSILYTTTLIPETPGTTSIVEELLVETGDYYWRVKGTWGVINDVWSETFYLNIIKNEDPPVFLNENVNPFIGDTSDTFNFSVTYQDLDNNAPAYINVFINGSQYVMSKVNAGDNDYTDGCVYRYLTTFGTIGTYEYYFATGDGLNNITSTSNSTFHVTLPNPNAPTLVDAGISSAVGHNITNFTYQVIYTDIDNNQPFNINVSINGTEYDMVKLDPGDNNAIDGIWYIYSTLLDWGNYTYFYQCFDGGHTAASTLVSKPEVTPFANLTNGEVSLIEFNHSFNGDIDFSWNSPALSVGLVNFTWQISNESNFSTILDSFVDINEIPGITLITRNLNISTGTYYWRVKPTWSGIHGNWSTSTINITRNDYLHTYSNPFVTPTSGNQVTMFHFEVTYFDQDNNEPVYVNVSISGVVRTLAKYNASDNDYTDGCVYELNTTITTESSYYFFTLYDGKNSVTTPFNSTLNVTISNVAPEITGTDVTPMVGLNTTTYNFTAWYSDANNDFPSSINISINTTGTFAMIEANSGDTNVTDGKLYYYTTSSLDWGYHEFFVSCQDTQGFTNTSTITQLPEVNPFWGQPRISLVSPSNASVEFNWPVNFEWNSLEVSGITSFYTFQLSTTTSFSSIDHEVNGIAESSGTTVTTVDMASYSGTYYWRVRASYLGLHSQWSFTGEIDIETNNAAPNLTSAQVNPTVGNLAQVFNFTVLYTDMDNNFPYSVNISINGSVYTMLEVSGSDVDVTDGKLYYYATTLAEGYYWFQVQCDDGRYTNSSDTINAPDVDPFEGYPAVTLQSPSAGATLNSGNINFTWDSLEPPFGPVTYTWQISSNATFSTIDGEVTSIPETSTTTTAEINVSLVSGLYYWRVRAEYSIFAGDWSSPRTINITKNDFGPTLSTQQLNPNNGNEYQLYNITVIYTDDDNNAPLFVNLTLDGTPNAMIQTVPGDTDYTDGALFEYTGYLSPGLHNYSIDCNDTIYSDSIGPFSFTVQPNSQAPWVDGLSVTPTIGGHATIFNFSANYHDADGNLPMIINITINSIVYNMTEVSPGDQDVTDGKSYHYQTTLSSSGDHTYMVNCSDWHFTNSSLAFGPNVNPLIGFGAPNLTSPSTTDVYDAGWITFIWDSLEVPNASVTYIIEVSANLGFSTVLIVDVDITETPGTTSTTLYLKGSEFPTGRYYWRITPTYLGINGTPSVARSLNLEAGSTGSPANFWDQYGLYVIIGVIGAAVAAIAGVVLSKKKKVPTKPQIPAQFKKAPTPLKKAPSGKEVIIGKAETYEEPPKPMTPEELAELERTEKEVVRYEEKRMCAVHKGPIAGAVFICPQCETMYCMRCAKALKRAGEACWTCNRVIELDESVTILPSAKFYCPDCAEYHDVRNPDFSKWHDCSKCGKLLSYIKECPYCQAPMALTKEYYETYKDKYVRCSKCNKEVTI